MAEDEVKAEEETAAEEPKAEEPAAEQLAAEEPKAEAALEPEPLKAEEPAPEPEPVAAEEPAPEPEPAKAEKPAPEKEAAKKPKAAKEVAAEPVAPPKAARSKKSAAIEEIITTIKGMSVLELAELVEALQTEFGVSAAAPVAVAAAPTAAAGATAEPEAEEQTEFSIILKEVGSNKISVIKAVRELTTLGLKESKDLVESAPQPVKEGISKEEAATAKQKLEAAGATADIK